MRSEQARGESGPDEAMARPELSPMADAGVFKSSGLCRGLNSDRGSVPGEMQSSPGRPGEVALNLISERVLARPGEAASVIVRSVRGQPEFW